MVAYILEKSRSKRMRCWPPSTNKLVPVMARLSKANCTALAMSSAREDSPSGLKVCRRLNCSSPSMGAVSVRPGATPTTRSRGASAIASMVVAASSAALLRV